MQFAYVAFDDSGKLHRGQMEAVDAREAEMWVTEHYLGSISIHTVRRRNWLSWNVKIGGDKIPPIQVAFFFQQVAAMLRVGVSINRALQMQADSTRHKGLKRIIETMSEKVAHGSRISDALSLYPKVFNTIVVRLIRGAEQVGRLESGFQDVGEYVMTGFLTAKKIMSAMYYPVGAMIMLTAAGGFLVYKVFPVLTKMYVAFNVPLPALTVWTIDFTNFMVQNGPYILGGILTAVAAVLSYFRTKRGILVRDQLLLKVPVIGVIMRLGAVARFLRTLRSTLMSSLALEESLDLAATSTGNQHYIREISYVKPQIISGNGLAGPLKDTKLFPPLATQGLDAGEETGTLDESLKNLISYYDEELDRKVKGLAEALNPILTGVAAVGVGFLMVSTLLPMYYIIGHIKAIH